MATTHHARVRRPRRQNHRLIRKIVSEWTVVVVAHTVAVLILMVVDELVHVPCAR